MRNSAMNLTPEQIRAVQVFNKARLIQDQLIVGNIKEEHVSQTGSKIFVRGKIGRLSLPHEQHWVWNQCKAQKVIETTSDYEIVMKKLNPRRKTKNQSTGFPNYKLWVFVIKENFGNRESDMNFMWCEKGVSPVLPIEEPEEIYYPPIVQISSIHQFAFLIDFMEPHVAFSIFSPQVNIKRETTPIQSP